MTARCEDVVVRLSEPSGREDAEVRAHLEACADCRAAARVVEALERTAQSPSPQVLGHFATRVKAAHLRAQDAEHKRAPVRTGLIAGLSAVGAAAALALVLEAAFPATPRGGPAPEPAAVAEIAHDEEEDFGEGASDLLAEELYAAADEDSLLDDDLGGI